MIRRRRLPRFLYKAKSRKNLYLFRFLLFILFVLATFLILDARMRPIIRDYSYSRAVYLAAKTINDAVSDEIMKNEIEYTDLIGLEKDESGRVTALHTNIVKINLLKASVTNCVIDNLNNMDTSELTIPLGTISGVDLFSGIGPKIRIQVVPLGQATASFASEFTSAGINQTRHRIVMEISATVTIILPRDSIQTVVTTHVDVAETVIVGIVPESYTNVEDATGAGMTEKIFNYVE